MPHPEPRTPEYERSLKLGIYPVEAPIAHRYGWLCKRLDRLNAIKSKTKQQTLALAMTNRRLALLTPYMNDHRMWATEGL